MNQHRLRPSSALNNFTPIFLLLATIRLFAFLATAKCKLKKMNKKGKKRKNEMKKKWKFSCFKIWRNFIWKIFKFRCAPSTANGQSIQDAFNKFRLANRGRRQAVNPPPPNNGYAFGFSGILGSAPLGPMGGLDYEDPMPESTSPQLNTFHECVWGCYMAKAETAGLTYNFPPGGKRNSNLKI